MKNNTYKFPPHKYTKDLYGKDILVGYDKTLEKYCHQIMMEWEIPYMKKCIEKLSPFGDVLEVGFGMGYSANEIQKYNITSHTIIECDPTVYKKALEWSKSQKNKVKLVFGKWEEVYKDLGKFDCLFYDPYDMNSNPRCTNIFFIKESLCHNSKDFVKMSYYCIAPDKIATNTATVIKNLCANFKCEFSFDKYLCEVPDNCLYIKENASIHVPLIEAKKVKNINYQ